MIIKKGFIVILSQQKVTVMLFLDIEGAFPHAVTDQLLHNMQKQQILEEYVCFVERMLTNQHIQLKFDGYLSDWIPINNGIGQGDPLLLWIFLIFRYLCTLSDPISVVPLLRPVS